MRMGIVRRLPRPVRRLATIGVDRLRRVLDRGALGENTDPESLRLLAKMRRRDGRRYVGQRVAVAGLFGARCGLQRGADLMVRDLRAQDVDVMAFDLTPLLNIPSNIETDATHDVARLLAWQPTDIVFHVNPPLFARALSLLPAGLVAQAAIIGFWVWELSVVPPYWSDCADHADEIWTPSPFVADAIAAGLPDYAGPVEIVPHAVQHDPMQAMPASERAVLRRSVGFAPDCFVAGTSFSFDSNYARKNPCGAIDAFRLAFRLGENVRLVIRCNDAPQHARLFEHLVSYAGDDDRIIIWDTSQAARPIRPFYAQIDVYLSLHRSEGYGLNLMEAAQAGLPVIATGWGLAPDIAARPELQTVNSRPVVPLDTQKVYERYPGAVWAEPDVWDAAVKLRDAQLAWRNALTAAARNPMKMMSTARHPARSQNVPVSRIS